MISKSVPFAMPILFLLVLSIFSCKNTDRQEAASASNYTLEIVDSVQVDLLTAYLSVVDVQAETGNLLAIQSRGSKVYVISPEGEILSTMDRPRDDPQAVGRLLTGEFFEDGIALAGRTVIRLYDMDFNVRKSLKPHYPPSEMLYASQNHLFELTTSEGNMLLYYAGEPQTELPPTQQEFYKEFNLFDLINPGLVAETSAGFSKEESQKVFQPFGTIASDSRYQQGKAFYMMRAMFDVKGSSAYYAFSTDTTLYELSLPQGAIVNQYSIPYDQFIVFSGYTMGPKGIAEQNQRRPEGRPGRISSLLKVDDFVVLSYYSGLSWKQLREFDPSDPDILKQVSRADKKKVLILRDGQRVNADISFPDKVLNLMMADDNGYIWGSQSMADLEEEPELITLYKLKIVPAD